MLGRMGPPVSRCGCCAHGSAEDVGSQVLVVLPVCCVTSHTRQSWVNILFRHPDFYGRQMYSPGKNSIKYGLSCCLESDFGLGALGLSPH